MGLLLVSQFLAQGVAGSAAPGDDGLRDRGEGLGTVLEDRQIDDHGGARPEGIDAAAWQRMLGDIVRDRQRVERAPGGGYRAHNLTHDLIATFDPAGVRIATSRGDDDWRLRLARFGMAGRLRSASRVPPTADREDSTRLEYRHPELVEWWINDHRGFEQGFTIPEPLAKTGPAGSQEGRSEILVLELESGGSLTPDQLSSTELMLLDDAGSAKMRYTGLVAWDAAGRSLPATLGLNGSVVRIEVDTHEAAYPITVDPFTQAAFLKASNAEAGDQFGWSVAISGDTAIIGARNEDSAAGAGEADNSAVDAGAAYIFSRNQGGAGNWGQVKVLKASNADAGDIFGWAVAIDGDIAVVGARLEDSAAGAGAADNSAADAGAAYVFSRNAGGADNWGQVKLLKASNAEAGDNFGFGVDVSGSTIVVGATAEDSAAGAGQADNSVNNPGAAYVFYENEGGAGNWGQVAFLKASSTSATDNFGWAIGLDGDNLVVSAYQEDSDPAVGSADDSLANSGAAFVFARDQGGADNWGLVKMLKASNAGAQDFFGYSAAISGNTVVVGAWGEDSAAGAGGADNSAGGAGAAYVFEKDQGGPDNWGQTKLLKASNAGAGDAFSQVAISGDTIVVGAGQEDSAAGAGEADNSAAGAGAVYVFSRDEGGAGNWGQTDRLKASNAGAGDSFGSTGNGWSGVAISGSTILVGAFNEDSAAGAGGADNSAAGAGAAYVFTQPGAAPVAVNDTYNATSTVGAGVQLSVNAADGVLDNDTDADGDGLTATKVTDPSHGTLNLSADGSFTYTPDAGYAGDDTFTYKANDGTSDSNVATVTITVTLVNTAPVANADSYNATSTAGAGVQLSVNAADGVLDNDTDADGDGLTAVKVTDPANGTLNLAANGSFTYTPDAGFEGDDTFTYKANDGTADSNTVTVTITVTKLNTAPVAVADGYNATSTAAAGNELSVNAADGVLDNDTDADGDGLTAVKVTDPANGTLNLAANGSFTYTPDAGFDGDDTFTYKANDSTADSNTVTVTITVTKLNTAPVAVADGYNATSTAAAGNQLTVNAADGVLDNDTDVDGDGLTAVKVSDPANGTLNLAANGSFTYTPDAGFDGDDTFTYKANDGTADSNTVTVTITVTKLNTAPVAVADGYNATSTAAAGNELSVNAADGVLDNDTDADGDGLTAVKVTDPANGTLNLAANGSFTYTPDAGFDGDDTFTYKANDGAADSNTVTVTITVTKLNTAPVAVADGYNATSTAAAGNELSVNAADGVLGNDTDADGDGLTAIKVTDPANGTLNLAANGSFTYTPDAGFDGDDTFTYKANDGAADSNTVTVTITVTKLNTAPVAAADGYNATSTAGAGNELTVNAADGVLGNDTDADGDGLTAIKVTDPANGTLNLAANGSFTYTPDAGFDGDDTFTYKANDGAADSNTVTVTITVTKLNTAPVAVDDSYAATSTATAGNELSVNAADGVLDNDTDDDSDGLTAIKVTDPANGTLNLAANGSFTYTPDAGFDGDDTFTYKANDGTDDSNTVTVTITVTKLNTAPVAVDDSYAATSTATVGNELSVNAADGVLDNDTDDDSDGLTAIKVTDPANGTLNLAANGSFTYTPDAGFDGDDTFTYKANDGTDDSNTVTVTLAVTKLNTAPVAVADGYAASSTNLSGNELSVNTANGLLANDTDDDGDDLTAEKVTDPENGTLSLNANGSFNYTPDAGFEGDDTFTYRVGDGDTVSPEATVTISVELLPSAPEAEDDSYFMVEGEVLEGASVLANDSDPDGDSLTAELSTPPSGGALVLNPDGTFVYEPNDGFAGIDTFFYTASDGTESSAPARVTIDVAACRFALSGAGASLGHAGGTLTVDVLTNSAACRWEASSSIPWIEVPTGSTEGTGPATVTIEVEGNPRGLDRSGTVTVAGRPYVVNQTAVPCTYEIMPMMQSFPWKRARNAVWVETPRGCSWTPTSSDDWVEILGAAGARTGPGTLAYRVLANSGGNRRADITVAEEVRHRVLQGGEDESRPWPPMRLRLEATSPTAVKITWRDRAKGELGYRVVRRGEDPAVFLLPANTRRYEDTGLTPNTEYCYKVQAFHERRSGPVVACITTPVAGALTSRAPAPTGPEYVTEAIPIHDLGTGLADLDSLPIVRVYKNYEPWGDRGIELELEHLGYVHGENLFVHPMEDLAAIPEGTAIAIVPSASSGDRADQVGTFNSPSTQQALLEFVRRGGNLVVHNWGPGDGPYLDPLGRPADRANGVYSESRYRRGAVYVTREAVDHPLGGGLRQELYRLLEALTEGHSSGTEPR